MDRIMEQRIQFRDIRLEDGPLVQKYLDFWGIEAAGLQFSTLFLWGSQGRIRIAEAEDTLFISVAREDGCMCVGPITTRPENYEAILAMREADCRCRGEKLRFCVIPSQTAPYFARLGYAIEECRDNEEYIYDAEALRSLRGSDYKAKRNHIHAFLREDSYSYVPITPDCHAACMDVFHEWAEAKGAQEAEFLQEKRAIGLALANMEALGLKGGGIVTGGKLAAFSIGGYSGKDTAVIHFEKAVDRRGLFPLINRDFLIHAFPDVRFVNREEDMGDPGLRKAKLSYKPIRMEKLFCAALP